MEISKLYENAAAKLEKAVEMCGKSKHNLSSITLINTTSENMYCGINWKTLNDSFEEELTCSEDEAIHKMLIAGETSIESIVTLDPETKLPVNPCQKCLELIIKINPANVNCNIVSGKNSKVILTSLNSEIAKYAEQYPVSAENSIQASDIQNNQENQSAEQISSEPEGSASHTGIDASGLQMIFDDWESTSESAVPADSKPFNANSLNSTQQEIINTVQNMSQNGNAQYQQMNNMYGQPMNNMYGQQPMNNMYGQQPMNNMYGQQPMNNMYGQQPMNNMYRQQQPMNNMYGQQQQNMNNMYGQQPMNNMYGQQPMNNMYGQQPMNNMYGAGQQSMNNMYPQQDGRASLYLNNQPGGPQQANVYGGGNKPASANSSTYLNKLQAPVSHSVANTQSVSVYGTNLNDSDNNAIFKDRLNDILNSGPKAKPEESDMKGVMMSAKEKKNAAKKDAKTSKK